MTTMPVSQENTAGAQLGDLAAELISHDRWTREQILAQQGERLRALLRHAVSQSPYYRAALGPEALSPRIKLSDLPTLPKSTLMEEFDRIVTDPWVRLNALEQHLAADASALFAGKYRVFATSGTTGLRGVFVYSAQEWAIWVAVHIRLLQRLGVTPGIRLAAIGAPSPVHLTRRVFAELSAGRQGSPQLSVTTPVAEVVEALNAYQPEAIMTYASIASLLAEKQLEGQLRIQPRIIAVGAEVLTAEAEQQITAAWGIAPFNVYASTEVPIIAASAPGQVGLYVTEDLVAVEVVDEANRPVPPGAPGYKVLVTNLVNRSLPLIRYEISDSVVPATGPDVSSLPYSRIARVDGRSDDILRFPARGGGEVAVHPYRLRAPFAKLTAVTQYQIEHDERRLRVRVVLRPSAPPETLRTICSALTEELLEAGAVPPPVEVVPVEAIERDSGHAAKVKLVKSLVTARPRS